MLEVLGFLAPIIVTLSAYFWMGKRLERGRLSYQHFIVRTRWLDGALVSLLLIFSVVGLKGLMPQGLIFCSIGGLLCAWFLSGAVADYYLRKSARPTPFVNRWLKLVFSLLICGFVGGFLGVSFKSFSLDNQVLEKVAIPFLVGFGLVYLTPFLERLIKYPKKTISIERETQIKEIFTKCGYNVVEIICVESKTLRYHTCSASLERGGIRIIISDKLLNDLTLDELKASVLRSLSGSFSEKRGVFAIGFGLFASFVLFALELIEPYFSKNQDFSFFILLGSLPFLTLALKIGLPWLCFKLDRKAVKLGADASALISALEKEAKINMEPKNNGISMLNHRYGLPTLDERKKRVAA